MFNTSQGSLLNSDQMTWKLSNGTKLEEISKKSEQFCTKDDFRFFGTPYMIYRDVEIACKQYGFTTPSQEELENLGLGKGSRKKSYFF